jgi:N-acetyl-1-D-myo-inositol-2-amino-2-deoxy-alpha-D-glucopyranoside deacetylase
MNRLLAVFAHPDDETFRPGGTLALLAQCGVKVHMLTLTHGEAGSCGEPPLCTLDELSVVREHELRCACAALGIQPPRVLDYPEDVFVKLTGLSAEAMLAEKGGKGGGNANG